MTYVDDTRGLFQWQNAIFKAEKLSAAQKVAAVRLINHLNLKRGDPNFGLCNPAIDTIAEATGLTRRGVQLIIAKLIETGWIEREIVRGRTHSNRYRFLLANVSENANGDAHFSSSEAPENANGGDVKCEPPCTKMRTGVRPISNISKNSPSARGRVGAGEGADGPLPNLGEPGFRLRDRLGAATYESWLSKVALVGNDGDCLTLSAPSRFYASYVQQNFEAAILDSFRPETPGITRLNLVVRGANAVVSSLGARRTTPQAPSAHARWLVEQGCKIVSDRLGLDSGTAQQRIVRWLQACDNRAERVASLISSAAAENLTGESFRNVVEQGVRQDETAPQLPLGPVIAAGAGRSGKFRA